MDIRKKTSEIQKEYRELTEKDYETFIHTYEEDERSAVRKMTEAVVRKRQALLTEQKRMFEMFAYERRYQEYQYICGIDEVGRGPLAGPVVAGAVILPKDCSLLYLNDSKQLSEKRREELYDQIMAEAVAVGIGYASPERIDEINILNADYEAMREVEIRQVPIIKGDTLSASIAAASIVAKVTRDRLMVQYDAVMPEYKFASNKGYGSKEHIEAIKTYGPSVIHRRSFIKNFI